MQKKSGIALTAVCAICHETMNIFDDVCTTTIDNKKVLAHGSCAWKRIKEIKGL